MRKITKESVFHVISETEDGRVHYDYLISQDGPDDFRVAPARGTFDFPQRLNYFGAKRILRGLKTDDELLPELAEIAEDENVNEETLEEVFRAVVEIREGITGPEKSDVSSNFWA
jgi:hypothetical protein